MTTGYDILMRSPDLERTEQVVDLLLEMGATEGYEVDWPDYPDRWEVAIPGLPGMTHLLNMKFGQAVISDADDMYYGYTIEFMIDVAFNHDDKLRRDITKHFALGLAKSLEVRVVYNCEYVIWTNDGPGQPLYVVPGWNDSYYLGGNQDMIGSGDQPFVTGDSATFPGEHALVLPPEPNPFESQQ